MSRKIDKQEKENFDMFKLRREIVKEIVCGIWNENIDTKEEFVRIVKNIYQEKIHR